MVFLAYASKFGVYSISDDETYGTWYSCVFAEYARRFFFDGEVNPSWTVPIERDRGVDVADVWQAQQESRSKLRNAHRLDIAKHGLTSKTESDG